MEHAEIFRVGDGGGAPRPRGCATCSLQCVNGSSDRLAQGLHPLAGAGAPPTSPPPPRLRFWLLRVGRGCGACRTAAGTVRAQTGPAALLATVSGHVLPASARRAVARSMLTHRPGSSPPARRQLAHTVRKQRADSRHRSRAQTSCGTHGQSAHGLCPV
eukprot:360181-Chlamydomonas_euryale.AAC.1